MTFPELEPERYPLVIDVDQDRLILTNESNCERFEQLEDVVTSSDEWQTLFNELMPEEYLNENLYDWLKAETGYSDFDLQEMSDLATYVYTANYHGMSLEFGITEEDSKWCEAAADQWVYDWLAASDEMW